VAFIKDPNANLDYLFDWTDWLEAGDTITSHVVAVDSGDVVIGVNSHTTNSVTVWLSGGTVNTDAAVRARVTTTQGRIDDRTITLLIRER
jgi:hypothetical protein